MQLPKLLPLKSTSTTTEDHDQLSLHVFMWLVDHMPLPHLCSLQKFKGQVPHMSLDNARDRLMNSVIFMHTTHDFH